MALILIVDDDESIRDSLYELFSREHICQTARTGEEALARLEAHPYDVVLTDISLPGLSGLELVGHIRQKYPNVAIIVISGIGDRPHTRGLIKIGAFEHLQKPFKLETLEKSVRRALALRERLVETVDGNTH